MSIFSYFCWLYANCTERETATTATTITYELHANRKFQESLCDHNCNGMYDNVRLSLEWQNFVTSNEQHQKMMIILYYALLCHIVFAFNNLVISGILWNQRAGKFRHSEIFKEPTHKHTNRRRKKEAAIEKKCVLEFEKRDEKKN